jgi:hypothetical protein
MVSGPPETLVLTERALLEESPKGPGVQAKPEAIKSARAQVEPSPVDGEMVTNAGTGAPLRLVGDVTRERVLANIETTRTGNASSNFERFAAQERGLVEERETVIVQRWMSRSELEATQKSGLLRGGRNGTHYVTDAANADLLRARQRLALPHAPEVRVTLRVPKNTLSVPSEIEPAFNMPGGGMERTAIGNVPVKIIKVD